MSLGLSLSVVVSSSGKILSRYGRDYVIWRGIEAIWSWAKGEELLPLLSDGYVWVDIMCDECGQRSFIGHRYGCGTCEKYNLCKKKGHKRSLELSSLLNDDYY